jgi:signal transduction histidine kinase
MPQEPLKPRLSAADAEVVLLYEQRESSVRAEAYQLAASLGLIFMLAGVVLDLVLVPEKAPLFFLIRVASALGLAAVLAMLRRQPSGRSMNVLGHLVAVIPMVAILSMVLISGDRHDTYYAGLNLVLIGSSMLIRWPTRDSVVSALICVLSYMIVSWTIMHPDEGGEGFRFWFNNSFFLCVTAFFSCVGTHLYNRLRFGEFLLVREIERSRSEITDSHDKLQALDEAKTRFFANVSHELRTPLTLILGPLEHLKATNAVSRDRQTRDLVQMLEENGLRLLKLIDNLLDLVRLDSAAMALRLSSIPTKSFIEGMGAALGSTAGLKGIQLDTFSDAPADHTCHLDRDRLEKIILNLGMNAIKFTPRGGRISLAAMLKSDGVVFEVRDTGCGIKASDQQLIFEPFWQADMSARRKHSGVGIGLALTKQLTESMRGKIDIETEEDKGTIFRVHLPLTLAGQVSDAEEVTDLDPVETLHIRAQLSGLNEDDNARTHDLESPPAIPVDGLARARLLIADDEPGLRRYLCTALYQHEIVEARDGLEAWELAKQHLPDLILLDMMMPGLDGLEVAKRLREHLPTSRIPIILVTANAEEAPRMEALRAGVNEFVTKPFSTIELQVRLQNLLKQRRFERELSSSKTELEVAHRELKENETRLVHAESLSALGRMSAGIIHEINNPLNYANTALHTLKTFSKALPEDERPEYADIIGDLGEGLQRVINIVTDLRSFTKGGMQPSHEVDLNRALESARRLVSSSIGDTALEWKLEPDLVVWGSDNQLVQVFVNIIQNASSFVGAAAVRGDKPLLSVTAQSSEGGSVMVSIRDNGSGIRKEDLGRVFEPFFTRRDVGSGMGLGLSICHQICQSHEATLEVNSEHGQWTEFTITFPPPSLRRRGRNTDQVPMPRN